MTSPQLQKAILRRLGCQGATGPFCLADELGEAPFRIIAELKELDRQRLTREHPRHDRIWQITPKGYRHLNIHDQLKAF